MKAICRVTADLVEAHPERPTEGMVRIFVYGAGSDNANISSTVEKCIRDSGAIDVDAVRDERPERLVCTR